MMHGSRFVFLDKDGTLVDDVPYNVDPARIRLAHGAESLVALRDIGFGTAVVSNQSGVALGRFPERALLGVEARLTELLGEHGIELEAFLYCPHHPEGTVAGYSGPCACRKPAPGLLLQARDRFRADLSRSWMVGDTLDDMEAGRRAGCRTMLIDNGGETEWVISQPREPDVIVSDLAEATEMIFELELAATLPHVTGSS